MSSDNMYVPNSVYNETLSRYQEVGSRITQANRMVSDARNSLNQAEKEADKELSRARMEANQRLGQEGRKLDEKFANLEEELRLEIGRQNIWIKEQMNRVRRDISGVNRNIERVEREVGEIAREFERRFQGILARINNQKERATTYCEQLGILYGNINTLHPDKLAPSEAQLISDALDYINGDICNEQYEAAIGLAQSKIPDAMLLQARLEIMNDEYAQAVVQVHNLCNDMGGRFDNLKDPEKNKHSLRYDEVEVMFDGRIQFWSSGLFNTLIERYENFCALLSNQYEPEMETDKIRETSKELERLNDQMSGCVDLSHNEYCMFRRVGDLSRDIYNALVRGGSWKLTDSGFVNDDERRAYNMTFYNGGDMVGTIIVMQARENLGKTPKGENVYGPIQFRVVVNCNTGRDDIKQCEVTRDGIITLLSEEGIDVGRTNISCNSRALDDKDANMLVEQYISESDKIKNGRIIDARGYMGI